MSTGPDSIGQFLRGVVCFLAVLGVTSIATSASGIVIDFDSLSDISGPPTLPLPEATFAGAPGGMFLASVSVPHTPPKAICAIKGIFCDGTLTVTFTAAVTDLTFFLTGDHAAGDIGDVEVFDGETLVGVVDLVGNGDFDPNLVDLTSFARVTEIIVTTDDLEGLFYDTFSFEIAPPPSGVPTLPPLALAIFACLLAGSGYFTLRSVQRRRG